MKKPQIIVTTIIFLPLLIILSNHRRASSELKNNITFHNKLSDYNLFEKNLADLEPHKKAIIFNLESTLFTDYAEKQRIIFLPTDDKLIVKGSGLPDFPSGTIIAKTFYYPTTILNDTIRKFIVETRLLIKKESQWNGATYKWNQKQDEAYLLEEGATVPLTFEDNNKTTRSINYKIPSKLDCISCHRQGNQIYPIGPKIRNLNTAINKGGYEINQLEYFKQKMLLDLDSTDYTPSIVDHKNDSVLIAKRARAYLDINCAHCHNPNGIAYLTMLDLREETSIYKTGILLKQGKIVMRMSTLGELHMPKIGTTIIHDEGLQLILDYIENLNKN
ncbi:hypothetical protein [Flavivirga sp. 57AJ16]|uniref:hypothetical protein n=1 Tax=Flavivirga sp. 57AJ16 TaxID=3025307 RepID=UPI002365D4A8|nr:hypothetical protein [Flavivirga sp. 57AJ16]MDD7885071.1 hypothetical protein [Flavivirga sp. 57AJ16]